MTAFTFHISPQDLQILRKHAQSIDGHASPTTEEDDSSTPPIKHYPSNNHDDPRPIEKKKLIPRTVDVYRLKGIVGHLFAIRPFSIKLVWETDEWDPVGEGDGGWSVSEDDDSDDDDDDHIAKEGKRVASTETFQNTGEDKAMWKRREMELVDGTREVGFFVEGMEARVRVEAR